MGRGKARGGVVNRRGLVVIPFVGRDVCTGWEPGFPKPAGTA